jgi:hypothetical protein
MYTYSVVVESISILLSFWTLAFTRCRYFPEEFLKTKEGKEYQKAEAEEQAAKKAERKARKAKPVKKEEPGEDLEWAACMHRISYRRRVSVWGSKQPSRTGSEKMCCCLSLSFRLVETDFYLAT